MIRRMRILAVAITAALALGALGASMAQGAGAFTAGGGANNAITGNQLGQITFTTTHGSIKCTTVTFAGTTTAVTMTDMKLTPTYTGCKWAGLNANVNVKSCFYTFTSGDTVAGSVNSIAVTTHLECAVAGDAITYTIPGIACSITVPPQTVENGMTFNNSGTIQNMDILALFNSNDIDYTIHEPTTCPSPSMITSHTEANFASYVGEATLSAAGGLTVH